MFLHVCFIGASGWIVGCWRACVRMCVYMYISMCIAGGVGVKSASAHMFCLHVCFIGAC